MDANKLLKKLEEIKVEAYNNLSSSEKESMLQVESETEMHNCEDAKGEDVKLKEQREKNTNFLILLAEQHLWPDQQSTILQKRFMLLMEH